MITILITIGLALLAIFILVNAYWNHKEKIELNSMINSMINRRLSCDIAVLEYEKAVAIEALEKILGVEVDPKILVNKNLTHIDAIALRAIRIIKR